MILPTLYKKTATGAIQQWTISYGDDKYATEFGQVGGQIQASEPTVCKPKNEGRANATTAEQQAEAEAKALWTKKLKEGYTKSIELAQAGATDAAVGGGIQPMLAHVYWKRTGKQKPAFPALAQPKLDGMRCIAQVDGRGKVTLWSRERRPIVSVPHIAIAIEERIKLDPKRWEGMILDGELYLHTDRAKFRDLISMARKNAATSESARLEYHIYDCFDKNYPTASFKAREEWRELAIPNSFPLIHVSSLVVHSESDLLAFYEQCLAEGYEGAMYRNPKAPYDLGKRSVNLLKVKPEDDNEYKILGVREGEGKMAGCAIFICQSPPGARDPKDPTKKDLTFDAVMACSFEERRHYFEHQADYIGKRLTVTHQAYTDYGQPRCPRGKAIRED